MQLEVLLPFDWLFLLRSFLAEGCALLAVLEFAERVDRLVLHQLFDGGDAFFGLDAHRCEFMQDGRDFECIVVRFPEVGDDGGEVMVLFLHFLVVAAALFGLPGSNEQLHGLEDLVHPPHVPIHEMIVVDLQKPMILLVLLSRPVPSIYVFHLLGPLPAPPAALGRGRRGREDLDVGGRGIGIAEVEVGMRGLWRRRGGKGFIGAEHIFVLFELLLGEQVQSVHWARESLENYIIITLSKVLILPKPRPQPARPGNPSNEESSGGDGEACEILFLGDDVLNKVAKRENKDRL